MLGSKKPSYVVTCEEDNEGNLILPIPEEILDATGWGEGTTIDIDIMPGTLVFREVEAVPGESETETGN